jgi:RNA polymerase sigma-70 factor (ECF subfamily)
VAQLLNPITEKALDHQHIEAGNCEIEDSNLMERIQSRDERALETLIKRYSAMLRSVVGRMIVVEQDVTDVVEEVFLGVWNQAGNFDQTKGMAIGWIITMARRRAIDRVRRLQADGRAEMRFRISTETGTSHFAANDVQKEAAHSDTASVFENLLSTLPTPQCAVVRMAFYRGLSHREIACETGIPLGTIKTRIELGVKKLRAAIVAIGSLESFKEVGLCDPHETNG